MRSFILLGLLSLAALGIFADDDSNEEPCCYEEEFTSKITAILTPKVGASFTLEGEMYTDFDKGFQSVIINYAGSTIHFLQDYNGGKEYMSIDDTCVLNQPMGVSSAKEVRCVLCAPIVDDSTNIRRNVTRRYGADEDSFTIINFNGKINMQILGDLNFHYEVTESDDENVLPVRMTLTNENTNTVIHFTDIELEVEEEGVFSRPTGCSDTPMVAEQHNDMRTTKTVGSQFGAIIGVLQLL